MDIASGSGGADAPTRSTRAGKAVAPFVAASFVGSFLLFLVQPIVAKMLLPALGGAPSVWNTSMVFFQVMLVAGYGLAHAGMRLLSPRTQRGLQILALALPVAVLPFALPLGWDPPRAGSPAAWLLLVLALTVGAPFLMLSTCSPTLQHWFATGRTTQGRDPYFLYAAGNAGSLLALLAYPVLIEPRFSLDGQARLFSLGYVGLVALSALCAIHRVARSRRPSEVSVTHGTPRGTGVEPGDGGLAGDGVAGERSLEPPVTWGLRARWLAWSFVPSALLLAVTRHLSTDVMSVPMLWIVPLSLYLVTYIIAFGRHTEALVTVAKRGLQLAVIPLALTLLSGSSSIVLVLVIHLLAFFFAALLGHGRLAHDRPAPRHLTEFYLMIATGGALGGATTALVAPLVFPTVIEYPLAIAAALAMCPGLASAIDRGRRLPRPTSVIAAAALVVVSVLVLAIRAGGDPQRVVLAGLLVGAAAIAAYRIARTPIGFAAAIGVLATLSVIPTNGTLTTDRSFFGVTRVESDAQGRHLLMSGTTLHGLQDMGADDPNKPLTYYHPAGPIGRYFTDARPEGALDIGVVGLGAGSLAGYGTSEDDYTYYEIDPAVVRIAQDPRYFSYLSETAADVDIVLGDGRLSLDQARARYDLLVLDAFSSDSIPLHLLTQEAFATYLDRLAPEGILAVHITNRFFDIEPVLARLASEVDLVGAVGDHDPTAAEAADGDRSQVWVFLSRDEASLRTLGRGGDFHPLDPTGSGPRWTDSFSNVLSALRLR